MPTRRRLGAGSAWLLLALSGFSLSVESTSAAEPSPQQFLERIYARYTGRDGAGVALDSPAAIHALFDPPLATLILNDQARSAQRDEPPGLDGDPFVDAQDWLIADLKIAVTLADAVHAMGTVSFSNLAKPAVIQLSLVRLAGGWRVHEITYAQTTLTQILTSPGG